MLHHGIPIRPGDTETSQSEFLYICLAEEMLVVILEQRGL
jgi:hypothetical protein